MVTLGVDAHKRTHTIACEEKLLGQFLTWLDAQGKGAITVDNALRWVRLPERASPSWLRLRVRAIRGFTG